MNDLCIQKLLRLINKGIITTNDIKDPNYRAAVERRFGL